MPEDCLWMLNLALEISLVSGPLDKVDRACECNFLNFGWETGAPSFLDHPFNNCLYSLHSTRKTQPTLDLGLDLTPYSASEEKMINRLYLSSA